MHSDEFGTLRPRPPSQSPDDHIQQNGDGTVHGGDGDSGESSGRSDGGGDSEDGENSGQSTEGIHGPSDYSRINAAIFSALIPNGNIPIPTPLLPLLDQGDFGGKENTTGIYIANKSTGIERRTKRKGMNLTVP
jgi:hypothetical protein